MAYLQFAFTLVAARPLPYEQHVARDETVGTVILGEPPRFRTAVVVLCMVFAFLLALAQGTSQGHEVEIN